MTYIKVLRCHKLSGQQRGGVPYIYRFDTSTTALCYCLALTGILAGFEMLYAGTKNGRKSDRFLKEDEQIKMGLPSTMIGEGS